MASIFFCLPPCSALCSARAERGKPSKSFCAPRVPLNNESYLEVRDKTRSCSHTQKKGGISVSQRRWAGAGEAVRSQGLSDVKRVTGLRRGFWGPPCPTRFLLTERQRATVNHCTQHHEVMLKTSSSWNVVNLYQHKRAVTLYYNFIYNSNSFFYYIFLLKLFSSISLLLSLFFETHSCAATFVPPVPPCELQSSIKGDQ